MLLAMVEFIDVYEGPARLLASSHAEDSDQQQRSLDKLQRIEWIQGLAKWEVMFTGTFRWQASVYSATKAFEKFMRQKLFHLSYFEAVERNPSREGYHVHSLWADCRGVFRKDAWAEWFKRYGRCLIEPVRSRMDVSEYASKYLCKRDDWWNVRLQWHWKQKLQGRSFQLCGGSSSVVPLHQVD